MIRIKSISIFFQLAFPYQTVAIRRNVGYGFSSMSGQGRGVFQGPQIKLYEEYVKTTFLAPPLRLMYRSREPVSLSFQTLSSPKGHLHGTRGIVSTDGETAGSEPVGACAPQTGRPEGRLVSDTCVSSFLFVLGGLTTQGPVRRRWTRKVWGGVRAQGTDFSDDKVVTNLPVGDTRCVYDDPRRRTFPKRFHRRIDEVGVLESRVPFGPSGSETFSLN